MKTIAEIMGDDKYISYDDLYEGFGYEILMNESIGDYEGDTYLLFKDGDRIGWLVVGWGSCSGCDALEDCSSPADYDELYRTLHGNIRWHDGVQEVLAWSEAKDWDLEWYSGQAKGIPAKIASALGAPTHDITVV